jgi:hypothetical protein
MVNLGGETSVSKTDVWLTPPSLLRALGEFDLDPCSPINRPWSTAKLHYTIEDDGLAQTWNGRVWLNPPYGPGMDIWLNRLANHSGGGLALVFARTETKTFFDQVWSKATGILFLKGRVSFYRPDGTQGQAAGSPSVLIAYTDAEADFLETTPIVGHFVRLRRQL